MIIQWKWEIDSGIRCDRVPEEQWIEVHDIAQEAVIKTIPKKKKYKKAKWFLDEALQTAVIRREVKGKGEKELNARFERIARRDKKAILNDQCKELEETTEWERWDLVKKIRDTKGTLKRRWAQ